MWGGELLSIQGGPEKNYRIAFQCLAFCGFRSFHPIFISKHAMQN